MNEVKILVEVTLKLTDKETEGRSGPQLEKEIVEQFIGESSKSVRCDLKHFSFIPGKKE